MLHRGRKEQLMAESGVIAQVDPEQPHPDFVLNARAQISSVSMRQF